MCLTKQRRLGAAVVWNEIKMILNSLSREMITMAPSLPRIRTLWIRWPGVKIIKDFKWRKKRMVDTITATTSQPSTEPSLIKCNMAGRQLHKNKKTNTIPSPSYALRYSLCQRCWYCSKEDKVPSSLPSSTHWQNYWITLKHLWKVYSERRTEQTTNHTDIE